MIGKIRKAAQQRLQQRVSIEDAQEALRELLAAENSNLLVDHSADDPKDEMYWEICHRHILKLAKALGVEVP